MAKVRCPKCKSSLKVPDTAAGRRARCPVCHEQFTVPQHHELYDETISSWIELDVQKEQDERAATWAQMSGMDILAPEKPVGKPSGKAGMRRPTSAGQPVKAPPPSTPRPPPIVKPPPAEEPAPFTTAAAASDTVPPISAATAPAISTPTAPLPAATTGSGLPDFPQDLHVKGPVPHLVVRECSQSGVRMAFDAIFLEDDGFRASVPMRSVFTGESVRDELIARPLVFFDRSGGAVRSAHELESKYEQSLMPGWGPRDLIKIMGVIDILPRPFSLPMPYYTTRGHSQMSVACTTRKRADGGITAEVMIPFGPVALDWLRNVNGICGPEVSLLDRELALIHADAWGKLPDWCQQRIAVWCRFKPRERFIMYVSDADFGQRDMGLAGLVLTDQRLVFHKYHHSGEVSLEREVFVLCRRDEGFVMMSCQVDDQRVKMVKLHEPDLAALGESLKVVAPNVQVVDSQEL